MKKKFFFSFTLVLALLLTLGAANSIAGTVNLEVWDSGNNRLAGVQVYYNDYGNHYVLLGTTSGSGPVTATLTDGTYKFKAVKDHTEEIKSGTVPCNIDFQTSKFIVYVKDSDGNDFSNINTYFNDYGNHWLSMGTTPSDGRTSIELFAGTRTFRANKDHTDATGDLTVSSAGGNGTIEFQTAKAIGVVKDCDGTPLAGFKISFNDYGNHWLTMGTTGSDGKASIELFPGTRKIMASKDYTNETKDLILTLTKSSVEFNPTKVNWQFSGTIRYNDYGNHWLKMTTPFYLFAGTYDFKFDDQTVNDVEITGCSMENSVVIVKLLDSGGNGLAGGVAKYSSGGWQTIGTTPANGTLVHFFDGVKGNIKFRMEYAGHATEKYQDISSNSTVVFQTTLVTMKLLDSGGNPLSGTAKYSGGGWEQFGSGTTTTTMELLPNNIKFRVEYGGHAKEKYQDVGSDPVVVFNTVQVTMKLLNSGGTELSGTAKYSGGGWETFGGGTTTTTMELLPNNIKFRVEYGGHAKEKYQDVGSDPVVVFNTVLVTMKLLDSGNNELAGNAKYSGGGWQQFGSGTTTTTMELLPNNIKFRVEYGGHANEKYQDVGSNPVVEFKTIQVTMKLLDSGDNELAGTAKYSGGGWQQFGSGTTTTTMELLPNNIKFRIEYAGHANEKYQDVETDPVVIFRTKLVTVKLLDSNSNELEGTAKYSGGGWQQFGDGTTTTSMELLPNNIKFRVEYGGHANEKYQDVGDDPVVVFNTVLVTMKLLDSEGNELAATAKYSGAGWKTFGDGTTTTTMELLPNNIKFRVEYGGSALEKYQDVSVDPLVIFTGTAVTLQFTGEIQYSAGGWKTFTKPTVTLLPGNYKFRFSGSGYPAFEKYIEVSGSEMKKSIAYLRLIDHSGNGIKDGIAKFSQGGWQDAGTTNSNGVTIGVVDGLVGNVKFRMESAGHANEKYQNISANSFVVFQTTLVTMKLLDSGGTELAGTAKYSGGGWKTFGTGTTTTTMELLPNNIKFRVEYAGHANEKYQDVGSDPVVIFQTTLVMMKLLASDGTTELSGTAKYSGGGWEKFGDGTTSTTMELLPNNIKFRVEYAGHAKEKYQDVGSDPEVVFNTVLVTMKLLDSGGGELNGTAKYSGAGWETFGDGETTTTMELLPNNIKFRVEYAGHAKEMYQDVSSEPIVVFNTVNVTMKLLDSDGSELHGTAKYSGGGWEQFGSGTTTTSMELLPNNIKFRIEYSGAAKEKYQDVGSDNLVIFNYNNGALAKSLLLKDGWEISEDWTAPVPDVFKLSQNYPNPFNPTTTISFQLPEPVEVRLVIYNVRGELVRTLVEERKNAGYYDVIWNGTNQQGQVVANGLYFYEMKTGKFIERKQMMLLK